jgi:hypothetical protein
MEVCGQHFAPVILPARWDDGDHWIEETLGYRVGLVAPAVIQNRDYPVCSLVSIIGEQQEINEDNLIR